MGETKSKEEGKKFLKFFSLCAYTCMCITVYIFLLTYLALIIISVALDHINVE